VFDGNCYIILVLCSSVYKLSTVYRISPARILDVEKGVIFHPSLKLSLELRNAILYGTALLVARSRYRFPVASLGIFSVAPIDGTMCPEVDSASEIEYQGLLLG